MIVITILFMLVGALLKAAPAYLVTKGFAPDGLPVVFNTLGSTVQILLYKMESPFVATGNKYYGFNSPVDDAFAPKPLNSKKVVNTILAIGTAISTIPAVSSNKWGALLGVGLLLLQGVSKKG